jgi:hypothetical protein
MTGVEDIDAVTVTVVGAAATLVDAQRVDDGGSPLDFPLLLGLDASGRREPVRVLVWGLAGEAPVAYGSLPLTLDPDSNEVFPLRLVEPPGDCDADGIPDADDRCPSIADRGQIDADLNGTDDICEPGKSCDGNLLDNGEFEESLSGWNRSLNSTQKRLEGGHEGTYMQRMCKRSDGVQATYDVENNDVVIDLVAGDGYRADGWMRTSNVPGQELDVEMRYYMSDGTLVSSTSSTLLSATADWQIVTHTSTVPASADELGIKFRSLDALDGDCFDVDSICVFKVHVCE